MVCPAGSQLITDRGECQNQAAAALKKEFGGAGCYDFKAVGCLDNGDKVWFSTCNSKETAAHHGPLCRKGRFPPFFLILQVSCIQENR